VRGRLGIAAAVIVALGSLGVSYWAFFLRADPAPIAAPVASEPMPVPAALTIAEMNAPVEIAGPDGVYRPAKVGDQLSAAMRIRTGDAGSATLRAGDGSTVKLLGATSAKVEALGRELQRLSLGEGQVEADVRDDPTRLLELDLEDTSTAGQSPAARTRGASFVATSDGAGRASVATRRGEVILSARGKEVTIHTGQLARIEPGREPSAPEPIPPSLFLKVAWPGASRVPRVTVSGETSQGARVKVEGRYVKVAPDGKYRTDLDLSEGEHQLSVETTDVAGRTKSERSPPILIDSSTDFVAHPPKWQH
jgi:hypothetical protein